MSITIHPVLYSTWYGCRRDVSLGICSTTREIWASLHQILPLLKEACTQRHIALQPTTFFIDYETAVQNVARTSFPGITIKSCFFHYTQRIWRKVQNTGMQTHYSDDPIIHKFVRRAAVLPLVPQNSIADVWFNALEDLEQSNPTTDPTSFTDYVATYWVETHRHLWNHYLTKDQEQHII